MKKISLKRAHKRAEEYSQSLLADDPRFRYTATIMHRDKSFMHYTSAFIVRMGDWVVCFTEHHGIKIYHHEDLSRYYCSQEVEIVDF